MKFLNLFVVFLLVFSCSENKKTKNFEIILGKENSKTLTYLVEDFENDFLKRQYPRLKTKKAYEQFLIDLREEKQKDWQEFSKKSLEVFKKSKLRLVLYCIADSVWVEKNRDSLPVTVPSNFYAIKVREKCMSIDGSFDYNIHVSERFLKTSTKIDSLISISKNSVEINNTGSYSYALQLIPEKSEFLKKFINDRQSGGRMDSGTVARRLLFNNVDFDDYFIKRLIITEIVY